MGPGRRPPRRARGRRALTTRPPGAAPRAGPRRRRRVPTGRASTRRAPSAVPRPRAAVSTSARASGRVAEPQVDVAEREARGLRARVEREGRLVGSHRLGEATGALVEAAEEEEREERRVGPWLPREDLFERRSRLGRLAEPAATRPSRRRASASDGSAATAVRRDRWAVWRCARASRRRSRLAWVSRWVGARSDSGGRPSAAWAPSVSSMEPTTRSISAESGNSRRPRSAQSRASPQRFSPCARPAIASYHRRTNARCAGSSFSLRAISTAADSWPRDGLPSPRVRRAQSVWRSRATLSWAGRQGLLVVTSAVTSACTRRSGHSASSERAC